MKIFHIQFKEHLLSTSFVPDATKYREFEDENNSSYFQETRY